jgi:hypothetical protein
LRASINVALAISTAKALTSMPWNWCGDTNASRIGVTLPPRRSSFSRSWSRFSSLRSAR